MEKLKLPKWRSDQIQKLAFWTISRISKFCFNLTFFYFSNTAIFCNSQIPKALKNLIFNSKIKNLWELKVFLVTYLMGKPVLTQTTLVGKPEGDWRRLFISVFISLGINIHIFYWRNICVSDYKALPQIDLKFFRMGFVVRVYVFIVSVSFYKLHAECTLISCILRQPKWKWKFLWALPYV